VTLAGNRTLGFSTAPPTGAYGTLVVKQDGTGGRTLTLPSVANKILGSSSTTTIGLSTAANAIDIVNFYFDGTNYFWNVGQGYGTASISSATNIAGGAAGSIPYQTAAGATSLLAKGSDGQVLTLASGIPSWANAASSGVPYSGANQAVDLGAYDLTVNGLTIGKGKKDAGTAYQYNSAIGVNALSNFSSGTKNTALGYNALASVTSTDQNIAIGVNAMGSTTQYFQQSVAIGNQALQYNQGSFNTALGANSLSSASLTSAATYLVGVGALALWNNTSGQNNTGIGSYALGSNTTGNNNSALGQGADVSSGNLSNATAIGYNSRVSASNTIQLGNTSVTNVNTSGTVTAGAVTYPSTHGTSGQVLTTTGSGTLTFATPALAKPISDQFTATAAQTSFTLTQTPITNTTVSPNVKPNVWMYINGIRTNNSAYSIIGTTVTYTAASNNNYTIVVGDRIQFDYAY
jgi:hypothetical protein